jgi:uncharacterized repeat protein (TIGR03803 family)
MKTHLKSTFTCVGVASTRSRMLPTVIAGLGLMLVFPLTAQTFTTLHAFTAFDETYRTNSDGVRPAAGLLLSFNVLYGTAQFGGSSGNGAVFAVNTDGTGFTNLHSFSGSDGSSPIGALILAGNTLYGTAFNGGSSDNGTVFAVNTDGTGFTNLHGFTTSDPFTGTNSDGANPQAGLILSSNTLYGTANGGGGFGAGALFAVNTDGTSFTNLHSFTGGSDGAAPSGGLILSSSTLYGTAYNGGGSGSPGSGTIFAVNTNGTGFTNIHSFAPTAGPLSTNSDGAHPYDGLIVFGNILYGTAASGGGSGAGTMFALNTDGTGFTNLHNFSGGRGGSSPQAALALSGNTLYGTTADGGSTNDSGTVFAVNTDGTGFTNLYVFAIARVNGQGFYTNSSGAGPNGGLILSGNTLYGTAVGGNSSGDGTVFSLTLPGPQLTITPSGDDIVLTWPTNYVGYTLQRTVDLGALGWITINLIPPPIIVNGHFAVTLVIDSAQQSFYHLRSP